MLLVGNAETLLLVDNQQSEVAELDIALNKTVGAYYKVDFAALQLFDNLALLLGVAESRKKLYINREMLTPTQGGLIMLPCKHGRRH